MTESGPFAGRPALADFEDRQGKPFRVVREDDGAECGTWTLREIRPLPSPPESSGLSELDCFNLMFTCEPPPPEQAHFQFTAGDGFSVRLFAIPVAHDCMCVTIN